MVLGYFTNKSLCLDPRFWGQISGFIFISVKSSTQNYFLVATIYGDFVGSLVKTLYMCLHEVQAGMGDVGWHYM